MLVMVSIDIAIVMIMLNNEPQNGIKDIMPVIIAHTMQSSIPITLNTIEYIAINIEQISICPVIYLSILLFIFLSMTADLFEKLLIMNFTRCFSIVSKSYSM